MCGRFTLRSPPSVLARLFLLDQEPAGLSPRFNIAPTQQAAVVRRSEEGDRRTFAWQRWGLIPSWAKDPKIGARLINARAETVAGKPAFRAAFRRRRCLVPADGFYEWVREGGRKRPWHIRLRSGEPFAFAGLWERWGGPGGGGPIETFALLTTTPNELIRPLHDRMPVILPADAHGAWLGSEEAGPDRLRELLGPYPAAGMEAFPVSRRVNDPSIDEPGLVERHRGGGEPG